MDCTRTLLFESGLPNTFWNFAHETSTYLINRSSTCTLPDNKTPFEILNGFKPNFSNLRTFGCLAHSKPVKRHKLEQRSEKCIFLGYTHNGHKLFNLRNKGIQSEM